MENVEEEKTRILAEENRLRNAVKFLNRSFENLDSVFEKIRENRWFLNTFLDQTQKVLFIFFNFMFISLYFMLFS